MTDLKNVNLPRIENAFAGIVVVAQTFNPSIFTESWLIRNEILLDNSFTGLRIFSPEVSQFQTNVFQALIIPPKMQVTFSIQKEPFDIITPKKFVTNVIKILPHTPFIAVGLNYDFFVSQPSGQDFNKFDRSFLGEGDCVLLKEFNSDDSRFGRYFSKEYGSGRFKLDIKPVQAGQERRNLLQWSFNYHSDIAQLDTNIKPTKAQEIVESWESVYKYARSLVELI